MLSNVQLIRDRDWKRLVPLIIRNADESLKEGDEYEVRLSMPFLNCFCKVERQIGWIQVETGWPLIGFERNGTPLLDPLGGYFLVCRNRR